jgi:hypothetical protein
MTMNMTDLIGINKRMIIRLITILVRTSNLQIYIYIYIYIYMQISANIYIYIFADFIYIYFHFQFLSKNTEYVTKALTCSSRDLKLFT